MPKKKTKSVEKEEVKSFDDMTEEERRARARRFLFDAEDVVVLDDEDEVEE